MKVTAQTVAVMVLLRMVTFRMAVQVKIRCIEESPEQSNGCCDCAKSAHWETILLMKDLMNKQSWTC